jgi:cell wall-associated NlpC family hydrolase
MLINGLRHKNFGYGLVGAWVLFALLLASCASPGPITPSPKPITPQPESTAPQPEPSEQPPVETPTNLPTIYYTIQVGAFSTTERAARYALELRRQGLDAYYFINGDGLYKVRFERFKSKAAARRRALNLQAAGLIKGFFVVEPITPVAHFNPQSTLRQNIVKTAHRFIGTRYRWGGESASRGFDCSGLTMTVYRLNGLELPRSSRSQFRKGKPIKRKALLKGDLVFFSTKGRKGVSHVGVYTGKGKFIHAPGRGKRICTSSLDNKYFRRRYMGARRYF